MMTTTGFPPGSDRSLSKMKMKHGELTVREIRFAIPGVPNSNKTCRPVINQRLGGPELGRDAGAH